MDPLEDTPNNENITDSLTIKTEIIDHHEDEIPKESNLTDEQNKSIAENLPESKDSTNEEIPIHSNKDKSQKLGKRKKGEDGIPKESNIAEIPRDTKDSTYEGIPVHSNKGKGCKLSKRKNCKDESSKKSNLPNEENKSIADNSPETKDSTKKGILVNSNKGKTQKLGKRKKGDDEIPKESNLADEHNNRIAEIPPELEDSINEEIHSNQGESQKYKKRKSG